MPDRHSLPAVEQVRTIAHGLCRRRRNIRLSAISEKSAALAQTADAMLDGNGAASSVMSALDELLAQIEREQ